MKGVILAGGSGSRLAPLTNVTNKHLLPVFDRPMVAHPMETLKSMGIKNICVVTGGDYISDFMRFLGSGSNHDVHFTYKIQDGPLGIAHALLQAEHFFGKDKVVAILGDNIFERVEVPKEAFTDGNAYIFLKKVKDASRFGVAEFDGSGKVINIEEKPKQPKSDFAVTGLYIYPNDVFDFIKTLSPSARNELEITDVNNHYLKQGKLKAIMLDGFWSDAGTIPTLLKASILKASKQGGMKLEDLMNE
ncbi:MAG TPA: sugar phosphate nucleotidyltransferase [archaeon]|nr:sugar phosphate nucleotidyltransferase [archaeon]